jgi:hypothetical protein
MKFYSIKQGKAIMVPKSMVKHEMTSNGRHMATARVNDEKVYKFVSASDAKKLKK